VAFFSLNSGYQYTCIQLYEISSGLKENFLVLTGWQIRKRELKGPPSPADE